MALSEQNGTSSAELMDELENLPSLDLKDEFVPVDVFFDSYVQELSNRTKRHHAEGLLTVSPDLHAAKHARSAAPPGLLATAGGGAAAAVAAAGQAPAGYGVPPAAAFGAGLLGAAELSQLLMGAGGGGGLPGAYGGLSLPPGGMVDLSLGGVGGSGSVGHGEDGHSSGADARGSGGGGHGRKSVKQQEANKQAQQRYRERKKAKFQEMEDAIAALRGQVARLEALENRNTILESMNTQLQTSLVDKERELDRMKAALDSHTDASLDAWRDDRSPPDTAEPAAARPGAACGVAAAPAAPERASSGSVSCDVLPRDLAGIDFQAGFADQIERLRAFVSQQSLLQAAPDGSTLAPGVLSELAQLVGRSCQLCQAALRAEGVKVVELITRDACSLSSVGDGHERWRRALRALRMSAAQQEQLLLLRASHLVRMRAIYQERQELNMQAMRLMLPHHSRDPGEDNTVDGRLRSMAAEGYLPAAALASAELGATLDTIRANLRREQRAVMDLNCCLISRILSPVQGALYMVEVYPQHCDALALSNALAEIVAQQSAQDGGAAGGALPQSGGAACGAAGGTCCG